MWTRAFPAPPSPPATTKKLVLPPRRAGSSSWHVPDSRVTRHSEQPHPGKNPPGRKSLHRFRRVHTAQPSRLPGTRRRFRRQGHGPLSRALFFGRDQSDHSNQVLVAAAVRDGVDTAGERVSPTGSPCALVVLEQGSPSSQTVPSATSVKTQPRVRSQVSVVHGFRRRTRHRPRPVAANGLVAGGKHGAIDSVGVVTNHRRSRDTRASITRIRSSTGQSIVALGSVVVGGLASYPATQVSRVHGFPSSSQTTVGVPVHSPLAQTSPSIQSSPSSQGPATGG